MARLEDANFVRLLDERLKVVSDDTKTRAALRSMIPVLAKMENSESAWEEYFSVTGVGDIPEFNGKLTSTVMYPGYHKKIEPKEYAVQIVASRTLIDDKKYSVLDSRAEALMQGLTRTKEKKLSKIFSNATSTAFDFMESEEGVSLASTAHLTKAVGVSTASGFSNAGTSPMNKTSIAATRLKMRKFRSDIGERVGMPDRFGIVCPDFLADTAEEVNSTPSGLDVDTGNINPQKGRYTVIPYDLLDDTSTTSWAMVDLEAMKRDLIFLNRIDAETPNTVDWSTMSLQQAIYSRFAVGFIDWRWIYWHTV